MINWYVLQVFNRKSSLLVNHLNKYHEIEAFQIFYEYYHRSHRQYEIKPMFVNYIFVKTKLNQAQFSQLLDEINSQNNGLIKQIKNKDTSALRDEEIQMFEKLMDKSYIIKKSQIILEDKRAKVIQGPLKIFENNIIKIDKHDRYAYLNLWFINHQIKVGIEITSKK